MVVNQLSAESDIARTAIFAYDAVSGQFKVVALDASGALITAGGGGGGTDVAIHDFGTPANHLAVDASGRVTALISGTVDVSDRAVRDLGRVRIWDGTDVATVNALGALDVSVPDPTNVAGKGTLGAPSGGVLTVQGGAAMTPIQVGDNAGSLTVDGTVAVGAEAVDKAAWTEGTSKDNIVAGVVNDTIVGDPVENSSAALRITPKRGLHTNLRNNAGVELGDTVTPLVTQLVDGTTPTQKAAVSATGFVQTRALLRNTANGDISGQGTSPAGTENFLNTWARPMPATLGVTATAAAGTGVTATLPAAGAGLFHYVTKVVVTKFVSVAQAGAATVLSLTATNLPVATIMDLNKLVTGQNVAGDMKEWFLNFEGAPLKSSVANTASTVVAPAFAGAIWRVTVFYYTGS